jgi:hypothetical protein
MNFAEYCLNIPHPKYDYRPIIQALNLNYISAKRDKLGTNFIRGLIDCRVDDPRLLEQLDFRIPNNIRLQCSFYPPNNKSNFARNASLSKIDACSKLAFVILIRRRTFFACCFLFLICNFVIFIIKP